MPDSLIIRPACPDDAPTIMQLIDALAEYERLTHEVVGQEAALRQHLFGDRPFCHTFLAEWEGTVVGFALYFHNYSVERGQPGIYLEDLFVLPEYRGHGIGKRLLVTLAQQVQSLQGGQLQWSVLDWNEPAIAFYQRMGATIRPDDRICRLTGEGLDWLGSGAMPTSARLAVPNDGDAIVALIQASQSEMLEADRALLPTTLRSHLSGSNPAVEALLLEAGGEAIACALVAHNYSTFLTQPGIRVSDWFISPQADATLITPLLLKALATLAQDRQCGRVEWTVPVQNQSAIAQYHSLGATTLEDWRLCDVTGGAIAQLAQSSSL